MTNWHRDHVCSMSLGVGLDVTPDTTPEDDPEPYPYCGPAKSWPRPRLILIEMFSLETLCFAAPVTDIASMCGLVVLH